MPPPDHNPYVLPPKPERPRPKQPPQPVVVEPTEPQQPAGIPPAGPNSPDYGFIMEPPKPPRAKLSLPGFSLGSSRAVKIGMALGGLLILVIIFAIARSIFGGGGNTQALTSVAQEQQAIIHILENGPGEENQQQAALSDSMQNFSATAKISLTSAKQQLVQYMADNHKKIGLKALNLKVSQATDEELATAASNSTYESTFKQIMQTRLTSYEKALQAAYNQTSGPKGRELLSEDFKGAELLRQQLVEPST